MQSCPHVAHQVVENGITLGTIVDDRYALHVISQVLAPHVSGILHLRLALLLRAGLLGDGRRILVGDVVGNLSKKNGSAGIDTLSKYFHRLQ